MSAAPEIWSHERLQGALMRSRASTPLRALRREAVPVELQPLLDYASVWGASLEEAERNGILKSAAPEAVDNLIAVVESFELSLQRWLSGPESDVREPTPEYLHLTALLMAYDYARTIR